MDLLVGMTTFVRVVEAGNLSSAARQLRISTAAASRHITMLEGELDVALLARTTRKVTVTDAGQRYYERCLRVLREVTDAQATARDDGLTGVLRVSVPVTVGHLGGAALIRPLLAKHPSLRIDLRLDDRVIDLVL
jgi:DNA-binding transcriptional LysR family regulator